MEMVQINLSCTKNLPFKERREKYRSNVALNCFSLVGNRLGTFVLCSVIPAPLLTYYWKNYYYYYSRCIIYSVEGKKWKSIHHVQLFYIFKMEVSHFFRPHCCSGILSSGWGQNYKQEYRIVGSYPVLEGIHNDQVKILAPYRTTEKITPCVCKWAASWTPAGLVTFEQFLRVPVWVPNHPLSEKPFYNIQSKPLLIHLQAIPLGPITGHQRADISACPSASSQKEALDR